MCGICGIFHYRDQDKKIGEKVLRSMCATISHRGPDDEGIYINNNLGIGIRRLAIIDISGGHQPISNENKDIWVVFNGEIYNYRELREFLDSKGHRFSTKTDTETIVHLYEEKGEEFAQDLRGMFAIAIWDERNKKLVIARDRIGEKPLFYAETGDSLLFASEIKSILEFPEFKREIDLNALDEFLTFSYIPFPDTIFKSIRKLPPAHILICKKGSISLRRYWDLKYIEKERKGEEFYIEKLLDLLKESVKMRLMSDVPLGAFLSGGIDSSTIVAIMSMLMNNPVETFSVGYEDESKYFQELEYAKIIADKFKTNHNVFIVKPEFGKIFPEIVKSFDEPFGDLSIFPSYYICKMGKEKVTVALSGLGGDELFAGYDRYNGVLLADKLRLLSKFIPLNAILNLIRKSPEPSESSNFISRVIRFLNGLPLKNGENYLAYLSNFIQKEKEELYSKSLRGIINRNNTLDTVISLFNSPNANNLLNKLLFVDVNLYLPDDILALTDRLSMAHSLEVRVPFLDHKLLEFAASIPPDLKIRYFRKKYILIKAISKFIPKKVIFRRKQGFVGPTAFWLRRYLKDFTLEILSDSNIRKRGYFDPGKVNNLLEEHFSGRKNHQKKITALLSFEIWHKLYLDKANL